jgi:hypothetical protein
MYILHTVYYVEYYGYSSITLYPQTFQEGLKAYQDELADPDAIKCSFYTPKNVWMFEKFNDGTLFQHVCPRPEWARVS